ncbi:MAG: hypothetical protein ACYSRZ_05800 [Planctomycetota bacterium]
MFKKLRNKIPLKVKIFEITWYPSSRSCINPGQQKAKPQHMPPLMVRKAEWRR